MYTVPIGQNPTGVVCFLLPSCVLDSANCDLDHGPGQEEGDL